MKILETNYKAKCPIDSSAVVNLCEEETEIYDGVTKKDLKIHKLFLMTESGIRFSNQEIEKINRERIECARKYKKRYTNENPTLNY
jgi:hypothetical protein